MATENILFLVATGMSLLASHSHPRSRVRVLLDAFERFAVGVFGLGVLVDATVLFCLPVTTMMFWWAIVFNLLGTVALFLGMPLWDAFRRRIG